MRTSPRLGVLPRILVGAIAVVLLLGVGRAVDLGALSSVAADGRATTTPPTAGSPTADSSTSGSPAAVAPLGKPVVADVLLTSNAPIPADKISQVDRLPEVTAVEPFRFGTVDLAGAKVPAYGVNPSTFRNWAVQATAASDGFWRSLANGEAAASFAAAKDLNLPLGGRLPLGAAKSETMRLGSFATVGFPDAETVLAEPQAAAIGLPPSSGLLLSAPDADLRSFLGMLSAVFGPDVAVRPLREVKAPTATNPGSTPSATASSSTGPTSTGLPGYSMPAGGTASSPGGAGTASSATVARVIETAKSRIGAPYVYGASGPDSFDCSGFTSWVFRQVGVGLPRTAHEQWLSGPHVSYAEAQPGDILAWAGDSNAPNYVTHVAIYLGNGQMIAAPHSGSTVNISSVYTSGLLGAVRVLQ
jgi:cell wall-associated NlpC family hydrolase